MMFVLAQIQEMMVLASPTQNVQQNPDLSMGIEPLVLECAALSPTQVVAPKFPKTDRTSLIRATQQLTL